MGLAPNATNITVRQVLEKLDGEFAATASAVENGEFALWVGSGISRKAPSLGGLIAAAMEYLRVRAVDPTTEAGYMPALDEALQLAGTDRAAVGADLHSAFATWGAHDAIVSALWNSYSRVLDIRVGTEPGDFVLWMAIDIRRQFENPPPPAAAHLCIALLVLEGAVKTIASGNWDGFIEAAIDRLGGGIPGILQVVVDPDHLRDPPGLARLLKFHGCIIHAEQDEGRYRRFLTGSHTQIAMWPNNPNFAAMRNEVLGIATNRKTMVLGLSIQDMNLQGVFAAATGIHKWPWPCAPDAPGHVFCEEQITQGQRDVLRIVYGDDYNGNVAAINAASHMRAWGEQMLVALVLKMVADKLNCLMGLALAATGRGPLLASLASSVNALRDQMADGAVVDATDQSRTPAVNKGINLWSRAVAVFRGGQLPQDPAAYEPISPNTIGLLATDQNARASRLGHLAIVVALLEHGRSTAQWSLASPADDDLSAGVASLQANRAGAPVRPVFLVKSASEAIRLQADGAYANDNSLVIHSDDTWHLTMASRSSRSPSSAPGRTGSLAPSHVSVESLLRASGDIDELRASFAAEVLL
ncbi:SIR2 family protein [Sphingomonas yunnanensis]|uniref:SIR2 family protein n=1 Tax=Sphingomonas yunnanensis TaxID=310400 RepID=UPI001CA73256|nr:SIR2 family protein [Sphingomonas yunnanensis]MBY9061332.1 SIR2 family protein [Sphingomonas yunnanensis]